MQMRPEVLKNLADDMIEVEKEYGVLFKLTGNGEMVQAKRNRKTVETYAKQKSGATCHHQTLRSAVRLRNEAR